MKENQNLPISQTETKDLKTLRIELQESEITMEMTCDLRNLNLTQLVNRFGEANLHAELVDMIIDLQLNLNISKGMNEEQCVLAAKFISKEFKTISLQDFALVCANGIKGVYGPIFDRLDVAVICEWITKHLGLKDEFKYKGPDFQLKPEQVENLRRMQKNKITEPAKTEDIIQAKGMPDNVRQGFIAMFKKHGIKNPFEKDSKKESQYKWPEPKDDFEKDCLEVFTEKWKEQKETVLRSNNRPYMIFEDIMFNPDNWLTYCYQLKLKSEIK